MRIDGGDETHLGKLSTQLERECTKLKGVHRHITILRDELSSMSTALAMVSELEEANPQVWTGCPS